MSNKDFSKNFRDNLFLGNDNDSVIDFGFDRIGSFFVIVNRYMLQDENDIFITVALNDEDALNKYAKEHYIKNKFFINDFEERSIESLFWSQLFVPDIYEIMISGYVMVINDDKFAANVKEVIENFFDGNKLFSSELIDFYFNKEKTFEELSEELKLAIALKYIQKQGKDIIIKRYN